MPSRLSIEDVSEYVAIRREMLADSPWAFLASPSQDRGSDPEKVRLMLARDDAAVVGERVNGVLGAVAGIAREEALKRRHIAVIWGVYVTPQARGRGLGKAVVARAIEEAKTWEGLVRLHLAVSENAPVAKKMYESLGFVQWGYEPDAIRIDGRSFGEHHLEMMVPSSKGSASQ